MATTDEVRDRFALREVPRSGATDGAWWPRSRVLGEQLDVLLRSWPRQRGRVLRVGYSPPDWDDRPRAVVAGGRRVKTGNFPRDDTHEITLALFDGRRIRITVIPPDTAAEEARRRLRSLDAAHRALGELAVSTATHGFRGVRGLRSGRLRSMRRAR